MRQFVQLVICILIGVITASVFNLDGLAGQSWYMVTAATLLAIGLYGSTFGIVRSEARQHLKIIASAVTVGVVFKALVVGGLLALTFGRAEYWLLGIIVAQIDPLSVASLMGGTRLSLRAKTILGSWASFDDPVTVLLALYAPVLVGTLTDTTMPTVSGVADGSAAAYVGSLAANLAFAVVVYVLLKLAQRFLSMHMQVFKAAVYCLLVVGLAVAVNVFWMLGVALMGLFLRPPIERLIDHAVVWALRIAAVLVGLLLAGGISVAPAVLLGVAVFGAQIVAGMALTAGLPRKDRWHIAFAQQNGITAIILALLFEPVYPGTVAIVAPAILVINILHYAGNKLLDEYVLTPPSMR